MMSQNGQTSRIDFKRCLTILGHYALRIKTPALTKSIDVSMYCAFTSRSNYKPRSPKKICMFAVIRPSLLKSIDPKTFSR